MGLRQMFPVQTKRIRFTMSARREGAHRQSKFEQNQVNART
jgi:hypothetical protein